MRFMVICIKQSGMACCRSDEAAFCLHRRMKEMDQYRVGIIGATGMVGQRFISLLKDHPW